MSDSDDIPLRGSTRSASYRRVSHGVFLLRREGLPEPLEFLRDLTAWRLVLPADAVFTHVTAARLRGWQLPSLPEKPPVFAAVHGEMRRPRRPGLVCSRLVGRPTRHTAQGLAVASPEEVLLRCARDLGTLDLVIMIDSALRLRHLDPRAMEKLLAGRRPGVRRLRAAWALADRRAESAGESVLRVFHCVLEIPVTPQVTLREESGRAIGRADLLVDHTCQVHEYDGAHHRGAQQHRTDLRRDRALSSAGFTRRGFTLDDLLNQPAVTMHELDRALGRPHVLGRLRRWKLLVAESLYSESCRERVVNRWKRQMGVVEWSGKA